MKRILFLLLLTVSVYGQNPSRFAKIQITGNTNSGTATKVNVQEANGEVNTQAINTAFNKNFGLNSGDVIDADNLLNQYSTVPSNWVAQAYNLGSVVFYAGKQWYASVATVASDVPNVSTKWKDITFEAIKTTLDAKANLVGGNSFTGNQDVSGNVNATGKITAGDYITNNQHYIEVIGKNATNLPEIQAIKASVGASSIRLQKLGGNVLIGNVPTDSGDRVQVEGNIMATSFITSGGTANQFLKADGSVDSNSYAPLASPSFTGVPTAPTASAGTNTTQLATTAFVTSGIATADSGNVKTTGNQTITSVKTISPTLTASANNQTLTALEVLPTFNNGVFTGVQNNALKINGDFNLNGFLYGTISRALPSGTTGIGQTLNITGTSTSSNISTGQTINLNEDGIAWANSTSAFGLYCLSNKSTNQPSKDISGFFSEVRQNGTGTLRTIEGIVSRVSGTGNGATSNVSLFAGRVPVLPFLITNFRGIDLRFLPDLTGGGVTNSRAIEIGDVYGTSTARGIDINVSSGVGKFNIYAQGTANNYFSGNTLFGTTTDNGVDKVQVNGTISASPATASNHVVVKSQLDAAARPYKVYTALISQTSTNAPTAIVLENTLGGTVVWSRSGVGVYQATLTGAFTTSKTVCFFNNNYNGNVYVLHVNIGSVNNITIQAINSTNNSAIEANFTNASIEIRVFN